MASIVRHSSAQLISAICLYIGACDTLVSLIMHVQPPLYTHVHAPCTDKGGASIAL